MSHGASVRGHMFVCVHTTLDSCQQHICKRVAMYSRLVTMLFYCFDAALANACGQYACKSSVYGKNECGV